MKRKNLVKLIENLELVLQKVQESSKTSYNFNTVGDDVLSLYGTFTTCFPSVTCNAPDVYTFYPSSKLEKKVNMLFEDSAYWNGEVSKEEWLLKCELMLTYLKNKLKDKQ